jgi:hypothetical protein
MMRAIVITTIFPPREAMRRFAALPDWRLIVVADRKTPADWMQAGATFLSVEQQLRLPFKTAQALPWNHYARKMLGYLWAAKQGAGFIAESDDDNLPAPDWDFPALAGRYLTTPINRDFINVYRLYTEQPIWPRGLPLSCLRDQRALLSRDSLQPEDCRIGVWQALADDDPDVDAIYRLTSNAPCRFEHQAPVVLGTGTLAPFNSQNTAFAPDLLPLMYLPAFVNFRVTDILRSYVAQPIMWAAGYRLGFTAATVRQIRNQHDVLEDFRSELPLYLEAEAMVAGIREAVRSDASVSDNLHHVYRHLARQGIVPDAERKLLAAWLEDVAALERT